MKSVIHLFIILVCMLVMNVHAGYHGSSFIISDMHKTPNRSGMQENDIIKGEIDSTLTCLDSLQRITLKPGQLIKRQKIQSESYGFYRGLLDTTAFTLKPPLYTYQIPHWARLKDMILYRLYSQPTDAIGSDEPIIYFDNERIYSRTPSPLHYYKNGIWFSLQGKNKPPVGHLNISSHPEGAQVYLNGLPVIKTTPCVLTDLIGGEYTVELRLTHHQFFQKTVKIIPDSITYSSFELIADVDTVFILGDASYSLLILPDPPVESPYFIDDSISLLHTRIRLPPGTHSVAWRDSDDRFSFLDTVLELSPEKIVYFDYIFKKRYGIIHCLPTPSDAEICIDNFGCNEGERVEELPVGLYKVHLHRNGFQKKSFDVHVIADTIITYALDLRQVPDLDGDGFTDNIDVCPEKYGLYDGCPTPQINSALKNLKEEIREFSASDPLSFSVSLMGVVSKLSTNRHFRNFLSLYSSGKAGGVNNFNGLTALNRFSVMYRGLYSSLEFGQWSSGLHYQRSDTLFLDSTHVCYFDSLNGIKPTLYIPSTAISFGFHYNRSWLSIIYAIGYQWEDLVFNQIYNKTDNSFLRATYDNDWWFHQLNLEADFNNGDLLVPSLYSQFKFPFGKPKRTHWMVFNAGLQLKIYTRLSEKRL